MKEQEEGFKDINTAPIGYIQQVGLINPPSTYITSSDEEMIRFAEWMGDVHSHKYGNLWYDNGDPNTVATTAQLLEKFRSLPTSQSKE